MRDQRGPGAGDDPTGEQEHLDGLYRRLDEVRAATRARRDAILATGPGLERDEAGAALDDRLDRLDAAEPALCFGRLDGVDGRVRYIGRVGLRTPEREPLLLDWRAPAARPFYAATPDRPLGLRRRRHLRTRGRAIVGIDDEPLGPGSGGELQGERALRDALAARRTGRLREVPATLQREQDQVVRADPGGVLVVQGGPGTGTTTAALHRAAHLLYTDPVIGRRGVLVVGPSAAFLDYVGQVLPALGETRVVLATVGTLHPGVVGAREASAAERRVKGDLRMADVVARAVRNRQGSDRDVEVVYDGDTHVLGAAAIGAAVAEARRTGLPHNLARRVFRREILAELSWLVVDAGRRLLEDVERGLDDELARFDDLLADRPDEAPPVIEHQGSDVDGLLGAHEREHLERELLADPAVARAVEDLWPLLTPEQLLTDLFADPRRLERAGVPAADRAALALPAGGWSPADVPLLDEAAELLGADPGADAGPAERLRRERIRFARQMLAQADLLGERADEVLPDDRADAEASARPARDLAERAADRTWTFGHVVVDEAQELSPMAWRLLLRRCPSGSMTVTGDPRRGPAHAAASWGEVLRPHAGSDWRVATLTLGYRAPAVIAAALPALEATDPQARPPRPVRTGGTAWRRRVDGDLVGAVVEAAGQELAAGGRVGVIAPERLAPSIGAALAAAHPGTSSGPAVDLRRDAVVLTPEQARGLEVDAVLVVDPGALLADPAGPAALGVALTRATERLGILHPGEAPALLRHVPER
ncbi:HelD family protein [Georgenia thermotolerans]|uniref:AAA family ATPase n=1 Tax=Georgenia thermotolerans TaxID=527326 RepID=A0A7J5UL59_9MICO|nr:AAA family ATPase [Georgenia thermotolerans]KAE8762894.1 AAA family ATPase [Georgenia thermotolerans]